MNEEQEQALEEMIRISQEMGLYDEEGTYMRDHPETSKEQKDRQHKFVKNFFSEFPHITRISWFMHDLVFDDVYWQPDIEELITIPLGFERDAYHWLTNYGHDQLRLDFGWDKQIIIKREGSCYCEVIVMDYAHGDFLSNGDNYIELREGDNATT
jgi:hypothetical protein